MPRSYFYTLIFFYTAAVFSSQKSDIEMEALTALNTLPFEILNPPAHTIRPSKETYCRFLRVKEYNRYKPYKTKVRFKAHDPEYDGDAGLDTNHLIKQQSPQNQTNSINAAKQPNHINSDLLKLIENIVKSPNSEARRKDYKALNEYLQANPTVDRASLCRKIPALVKNRYKQKKFLLTNSHIRATIAAIIKRINASGK